MTDLRSIRQKLEDAVAAKERTRLQGAFTEQLIQTMSEHLSTIFGPVLDEMRKSSELSLNELKKVMVENLKAANPQIDTAELTRALTAALKAMPPANVSVEPRFTVPAPIVHTAPVDMTETFKTMKSIFDFRPDKPMPVLMMDQAGKPFQFSEPAAGGRGDFFTIIDIKGSTASIINQTEGALKVSGTVGVTGTVPVSVAATLPVTQLSGANFSVFVTGSSGTTAATLVNPEGTSINGDNPLAVTIVSGAGSSTVAQIVNRDGSFYDSGNGFPVNVVAGSSSATTVSLVNTDGLYYNSANPLPIVQTGALVVSSITASTAASLVDSGGVQYSGSNPVPVILTGAGATVAAMNVDSSGVGYSGSNPLPVTGTLVVSSITASSAASLVDSSGVQYSGSNPLPVVFSATSSTASALVDSSGVQYSGSNPLPIGGTVTGITNSVAASMVDSSGVQYSGSNPVPITGTLVVSSVTASTASALVDSGGVQYSGSNPIPMTIISGAPTSTVAVGDSAARSADNGGNPLKIGGIARQTNPAAYTDGDRSNITTDDLGRAVIRTHQVRDLVRTAYVTLSTGTETTLLAASAGSFLDLLYVMGANTSSAAVQVDIRAVTAGNIVASLYIPANSTAGVSLPLGWPQDATGNNWTVDMGDFTNSNVLISALFSQEV